MVQMAVAARTQRIRLGQAVNIILWHHRLRRVEKKGRGIIFCLTPKLSDKVLGLIPCWRRVRRAQLSCMLKVPAHYTRELGR